MQNTEIFLLFFLLFFGYLSTKLRSFKKQPIMQLDQNINTFFSDSFNVYHQNRLSTVYNIRDKIAQKLYNDSLSKNTNSKIAYGNIYVE